ncbi:hypothetical protein GIY11_01525 [Aerococcaceae bacterium DSM 109653]|uniref:Uncharacterized protein n=1 Tax=Fundicoccus ignavus TaxID=2664442 RepID=A0A844BRY0_9LACT|nr:hypothetical protein [Fundicoccus ignavus]MRI80713.1 hypothetical protein [Fundicoccus ignavus]
MCFDDNNLELKAKVENYVTIDKKISELTKRKLATSATYYALHSLTGGMALGKLESIYHRAETTEQIALKLWVKERAIQRRIDRLKQKQRLFRQCMGGIDLSKLEHDLRLFYVTELEWQAYEAIGEIEYYLEEHRKTKERINGVGLDQEQQNQMKEAGNTLLNRIKELAL